MKKFNYILLPILFIFSSCYIYKPFSESDLVENSSPRRGGKQSNVVLMGDDKTPTRSISANNSSLKGNAPNAPGGKVNADQAEAELKLQKLAEIERGQQDQQKEAPNSTTADAGKTKKSQKFGDIGEVKMDENPSASKKNSKAPSENTGEALTLKQKLQPNKYYKINVENKTYKIQVDGWEGDSLKAHVIRRPNKTLKFHENQIDEESVLSRRFSKPFSDLFTVGAYAAAGAAVLFLIL